MDLCDPVELPSDFPGAERAPAVELRCWTARGFSSPGGESLSQPCLPVHRSPSFKEQRGRPLAGGPMSAHSRAGGWEDCCPLPAPKTSVHPVYEPVGFLLSCVHPQLQACWRRALRGQSRDNHRHRVDLWGWDLSICLCSQQPAGDSSVRWRLGTGGL